MSTIIEIIFHLIKCSPSIDYANYAYNINCDETKFNNEMIFQTHNTIKDKIDYMTDLKYFLKADTKGERIGVGSFELLSEVFYRKNKKCLNKH